MQIVAVAVAVDDSFGAVDDSFGAVASCIDASTAVEAEAGTDTAALKYLQQLRVVFDALGELAMSYHLLQPKLPQPSLQGRS